jgi:hypothetical protein
MLTSSLDTFRRLLALARREAREDGPSGAAEPAVGKDRPGGDLIFRMKSWPSLPESGRTAEVYRMLSIMSNQPVNRAWLLARFQMAPRQLDALMADLVAQGSVEVIDPARFAGREACRA